MNKTTTTLTSVELRGIGEHRFYKLHAKKAIVSFACIVIFMLISLALLLSEPTYDKQYVAENGDTFVLSEYDNYIVANGILYKYDAAYNKDEVSAVKQEHTILRLTIIVFAFGAIGWLVYLWKQSRYANKFVDEYINAVCSNKAD